VTVEAREGNTEYGPWNPGLTSEIPSRLMPMVTLYRPENSTVSYQEARQIADVVGLSLEELTSLRAQRLVIHELMVRVTADLSVPDGPSYEELGINLRGMIDTIFQNYAKPELARFEEILEVVRAQATAFMMAELSTHVFAQKKEVPEKTRQSVLARLFARREKASRKTSFSVEQRAIAAVEQWRVRSAASADPQEKASLNALQRVVSAIVGHRGRLINDASMITRLGATLVCNDYGSTRIGNALTPLIKRAAQKEGYRFLPTQQKPIIMNVKGASASGKSTIRNQQRALAERIGVSWADFALISPDYWRKYMIDYDALGDDYKYAAMLTGRELEIVDKKLDRYMAEKAANQTMSHLLIDRFRFDSFAPQKMAEADSRLLTRFGDTIYLFFMITPPEETVKRAWVRGLSTGRYKAVDDLLYHNIEAYTGMPQLFFSWVTSQNKRIHFEFLDNSVEKGRRPRTVAFGWNDTMTILDLKILGKIETYKHINIEARTRDQVYELEEQGECGEATFLMQCVTTIPNITLASFETGVPYAHLHKGECIWHDDAVGDKNLVLQAFGLEKCGHGHPHVAIPTEQELLEHQRVTVGRWGPPIG